MLKMINQFFCAVIFATIFNLLAAVPGRTQDSCATALRAAEEKYVSADFETALGLVTPCLSGGKLIDADAVRLYKLLSRIYLAQNDSMRAALAIKDLLKRMPQYEPDPEQEPPPFVTLVNKIKRQEQPVARSNGFPAASSQKSITPWIAGGVLAGVTALVVLWPFR
jgi:hypothetical protein